MTVNLQTVLLQGSPGGNPMVTLLMMGGMIAVMYFFMIRPQAKRAKEQKKFADSIAAGEDVITTSGIHGRISRVNDNGTLQIEISRNVAVTVERSAVSMEMTVAFRKKSGMAVTTSTDTK
jgi:preprotein translocase subunit YajC